MPETRTILPISAISLPLVPSLTFLYRSRSFLVPVPYFSPVVVCCFLTLVPALPPTTSTRYLFLHPAPTTNYSIMYQKPKPAARISRKRRPDSPSLPETSGNLIFEDPVLPPPSNNVVDESKVKQYIHKLQVPDDQNVSSCIKVVISDSEADYFSAAIQEQLQLEFGISSFSISDKTPLNVDRVITVYGSLKQTLSVVLFLAFVLNSNLNNYVQVEPFTLKSQNYHVDVLVECKDLEMDRLATRFPALAIDYSPYNLNLNLHTATLSGDLTSLFNSLIYIYLRFPYKTYAVDSNIKLLDIIRATDSDGVFRNAETKKANDNEQLLNFLYSKSFLNTSK